MVVDAKPARRSLDATPSDPTAREPVPDDGSPARPEVARPEVARPAIDPASERLARLTLGWPDIEAELVRKRARSPR